MKNTKFLCIVLLLLVINLKQYSQTIPFKMEELTGPEFVNAVEKSSSTVLLPMGVFEKHGPHLPLGTDLFTAREISLLAAEEEYTVVFPWYYCSHISEARNHPGTISYSPELIWNMLQETINELSRNGFKKIIIYNAHGGNNAFLNYFGMAQFAEKKDYALYVCQPSWDYPGLIHQVEELTQHDSFDLHAGNSETALMQALTPDLVHIDRASHESGVDQERTKHLPNIFTGIWWYAQYPNHYSGDGAKANAEAGELLVKAFTQQLVKNIRDIKSDNNVLSLQEKFFKEAENPLKTKAYK